MVEQSAQDQDVNVVVPDDIIRTALLVVDVQNDFCEGGSLGVEGGASVAGRIADFLEKSAEFYERAVSVRDWHIEPGRHFASALGRDLPPDFSNTWPDHCVAGTWGAEYQPAVAQAVGIYCEAEFLKGRYEAAYSAFEGTHGIDQTPLGKWLSERHVEAVDIAGIATDYCVRHTAKDASAVGLKVTVLSDLCAGVAAETSRAALAELREIGVAIVDSPTRWAR